MTVFTPKFGMGASVTRLEDARFITGKDCFAGMHARVWAAITEAAAK